jgi:biotin transport system substrate-specific component
LLFRFISGHDVGETVARIADSPDKYAAFDSLQPSAQKTDSHQEMSLSSRSMPAPVVTPHVPLAQMLWPDRAEGVSAVLRIVILIVLGTALLTLSAKINLPLPLVPMTLQTLVVLMIGAAYGWRLGGATVVAYLVEGAIGWPVFAGPAGGLAPLVGPTAGYLFGFVAAAILTGWLSERGWDRSVPLLFVAMGLGHILILAAGFAWLAFGMKLGVEKAWLVGIAPFVAASLVKNALGATLVPAIRRLIDRRA